MQNDPHMNFWIELKNSSYEKITELYKWILKWPVTNSMVIYLAEKLKEYVAQDKSSEINWCLEELKRYCSHWTEITPISGLKERNVMELTYLQSTLEKYAWAKHCENIEPPRFEWIIKPTQKDIVDAFYINAYWWVKIKLIEFKTKFQSMWFNVLFSQIENAYKNDKFHALLQLLTKAKNVPQVYELNTEEDWNILEIMVKELIYLENYRKK